MSNHLAGAAHVNHGDFFRTALPPSWSGGARIIETSVAISCWALAGADVRERATARVSICGYLEFS